MKVVCRIIIYLIFVVVLYVVFLRFVEPAMAKLYYGTVTKGLVQDKSSIIELESKLTLGIYRPELPYHYDKVYEIEDSLNAKFKVVSYYQAWGDEENHQFNLEVVKNISKGGYVPMITWEPWVVAFKKYEGIVVDSSLSLVIDGEFDYYIQDWARKITRYGKPIFLRLGHEMTNPWYSWSNHHGNSGESYVAMWKHVYELFQIEGAKNAAFVWSPFTPTDSLFYPGPDYVDWIALDIFNYGSISESGAWLDFYTITKYYYDSYKHLNKPIMVAEVGCSSYGGNKNLWYRDMFHSLAVNNFPKIKLLVLFDNPVGKTSTGLDLDWSMTGDNEVYKQIKSQVNMKDFHTQGARNHE